MRGASGARRAGRRAPHGGRACGQRQGHGAAVQRERACGRARSHLAGGRRRARCGAAPRRARPRCCRSRCARGSMRPRTRSRSTASPARSAARRCAASSSLRSARRSASRARSTPTAADVMALLAIAAGMPKPARADAAAWPGEPFGESVFGDLAGRVDFSAARATLSPTLTGRQLRGALRLGGGEVAIENVEGTLAGGRASGQTRAAPRRRRARGARRSSRSPAPTRRRCCRARAGRSSPAGSACRPSSRAAGSVPLRWSDRSRAPARSRSRTRRFPGSIRRRSMRRSARSIRGSRSTRRKSATSSATVLDGGALAVPRLDAPVAIDAGQARIGQTVVYGQGADLVVRGGGRSRRRLGRCAAHAVRAGDHRGIEHDAARKFW